MATDRNAFWDREGLHDDRDLAIWQTAWLVGFNAGRGQDGPAYADHIRYAERQVFAPAQACAGDCPVCGRHPPAGELAG